MKSELLVRTYAKDSWTYEQVKMEMVAELGRLQEGINRVKSKFKAQG
jgi:hypothetical protein